MGQISPVFIGFLLLTLLCPPSGADYKIRPAVWNGKFYPADGNALRNAIEKLSDRADCSITELPVRGGRLTALILPHAGYVYSGQVAAYAHCAVQGEAIDKVILMGPDHRVGFTGCALSDVDAYATPLGEVRLHSDAKRLRENSALFHSEPRSDASEHCLEVILPFLQVYLKHFELVPLVLGPCDLAAVAERLEPLLTSGTLVVASADLSHYLPYDEAQARDKATIDAILRGHSDLLLAESNRTCGAHPIAVLLDLARRHAWRPVLLNYATSGDSAGDRSAVVGYAAIAFYGEDPMSQQTPEITPQQGRALVRLARKTLMERFGRTLPAEEAAALADQLQDAALQSRCGTFVTLKIGGRLRGCIGSLQGREPLVDGIAANAINAAFHDPRFPALKAKELDRIVIEVSVLTKPEPLTYKDHADLIAKLRPRIDGVTIRKGHAGATFLPQVWDQLPKPEDFLSHLCLKAGLGADAWRTDKLDVETYCVQYFEESPFEEPPFDGSD